jgi:hypothetical protein
MMPFGLVALAAFGHQAGLPTLLLFALMVGVPFLFAGLVGGLFTGRGSIVAASAAGFGGGGAIGGAIVLLAFSLSRFFQPSSEVFNHLLFFLGLAAGFLIPCFVGGVFLGRAAENLRLSREENAEQAMSPYMLRIILRSRRRDRNYETEDETLAP